MRKVRSRIENGIAKEMHKWEEKDMEMAGKTMDSLWFRILTLVIVTFPSPVRAKLYNCTSVGRQAVSVWRVYEFLQPQPQKHFENVSRKCKEARFSYDNIEQSFCPNRYVFNSLKPNALRLSRPTFAVNT